MSAEMWGGGIDDFEAAAARCPFLNSLGEAALEEIKQELLATQNEPHSSFEESIITEKEVGQQPEASGLHTYDTYSTQRTPKNPDIVDEQTLAPKDVSPDFIALHSDVVDEMTYKQPEVARATNFVHEQPHDATIAQEIHRDILVRDVNLEAEIASDIPEPTVEAQNSSVSETTSYVANQNTFQREKSTTIELLSNTAPTVARAPKESDMMQGQTAHTATLFEMLEKIDSPMRVTPENEVAEVREKVIMYSQSEAAPITNGETLSMAEQTPFESYLETLTALVPTAPESEGAHYATSDGQLEATSYTTGTSSVERLPLLEEREQPSQALLYEHIRHYAEIYVPPERQVLVEEKLHVVREIATILSALPAESMQSDLDAEQVTIVEFEQAVLALLVELGTEDPNDEFVESLVQGLLADERVRVPEDTQDAWVDDSLHEWKLFPTVSGHTTILIQDVLRTLGRAAVSRQHRVLSEVA